MTDRSALRIPVESLGTFSQLGRGALGTIYDLSGGAHVLWKLPRTDIVYKEYDWSVRVALNSDVLQEMVQYATQLMSVPEGLGDRLAWPIAMVERQGAVSGFLMQRAPQQFMVRVQLPSGERWVSAETQLALNDERYLSDRRLPVHDRWRLQFLRDTADTLAKLHRHGILLGDLSPKSLLVSFTTRPRCFFLNCDTMRIADRSALPQVETVGWEIPTGEERGTIASDAYKFALLAIRLFARDQESKDVTALSMYPPLGELARRGISIDPSIRPIPADWISALDAAIPVATTRLPWEQISRRPSADQQQSNGLGELSNFVAAVDDSKKQIVPISIYVSGDDGEEVEKALVSILDSCGFEIFFRGDVIRGSWYRRLWMRIKDVASSDETRKRVKKLENALELELLGKRRAEVDKTKADAIASLISALSEQQKAVILVGSIVVVKNGSQILAETLTEIQLAKLEEDGDILRKPDDVMNFLRITSEEHILPQAHGGLPGHSNSNGIFQCGH